MLGVSFATFFVDMYKLNVVYYFDYCESEGVMNLVGMGRTGTIPNGMYGENWDMMSHFSP